MTGQHLSVAIIFNLLGAQFSGGAAMGFYAGKFHHHRLLKLAMPRAMLLLIFGSLISLIQSGDFQFSFLCWECVRFDGRIWRFERNTWKHYYPGYRRSDAAHVEYWGQPDGHIHQRYARQVVSLAASCRTAQVGLGSAGDSGFYACSCYGRGASLRSASF